MGLLDMLMGGSGGIGGQANSTMAGAGPAPSLSDRLSNPLSQIGLAMMAASGGPKTGFAAPIAQGLANAGKLGRERDQRNTTMEILQRDYPDIAQAVGSGAISPADGFNLMGKRQAEAREQSRWEINQKLLGDKFEYQKQHDADTLEVTRSRYGPNGESFGMQLVPGEDADGNYVPLQVGDKGTIRSAPLPGGVRAVSPGDLNQSKALGTARGKSSAADEASYGQAVASAADIDAKVQALKSDAGLDSILGPIDSRTPNFFGGATGAQAKLDQLKGEAFMQARQFLKGGGQITDFEGRKAEQAMARLDQAQSKADFIAALDDFNEAVQQGAQRLAQRTGNVAPTMDSGNGGAGATSGGLKWRVK